jgi:protein-tyrosine-phosphatase
MQMRTDTSRPEVLRLMGDLQRWRLLKELATSDLTVGELVRRLERPQNLISYHLAELRRSGLVSSRRSSADGRDSYYRFEIGRCAELLHAAGIALTPALKLQSDGRRTFRRRLSVLFLCTGNSARSQMAEALIVHLSAGAVRARSAGSHPKPVHLNAIRVMAERGIDISGRRSKRLERFARGRFDRVITLCDKVREICPEFPSSPVATHWSMADPAAAGGDSYPAFVRLADELESRIASLLTELSVTAKEIRNADSRNRQRALYR